MEEESGTVVNPSTLYTFTVQILQIAKIVVAFLFNTNCTDSIDIKEWE